MEVPQNPRVTSNFSYRQQQQQPQLGNPVRSLYMRPRLLDWMKLACVNCGAPGSRWWLENKVTPVS